MLIKFTPALKWDEEVYVDPEQVSVIKRCKFDAHYNTVGGEYSTLIMHNGEHIDVMGLPTKVAKIIRDAEVTPCQ
jgi:hypothetical protein